MSIHVEWEYASTCEIAVLTADEAEEAFGHAEVRAPFVLALGGASGGCLAIEGTAEQLRRFAARVIAAAGSRITGTWFICRLCRAEIQGEAAVEAHERNCHGGTVSCVVSPGQ